MRILAIDPGLNCTGVAWDQQQDAKGPFLKSVRPLTRSHRDKAREIVREIPDVCWDLLVIEIPQIYQGGKQKGDPNDLIKLSILAGNIEALVSTYNVLEVLPCSWKGQVPKEIHHKRLLARVPALNGKFSKDAMDALGILLYGQDTVQAQLEARRKRRL